MPPSVVFCIYMLNVCSMYALNGSASTALEYQSHRFLFNHLNNPGPNPRHANAAVSHSSPTDADTIWLGSCRIGGGSLLLIRTGLPTICPSKRACLSCALRVVDARRARALCSSVTRFARVTQYFACVRGAPNFQICARTHNTPLVLCTHTHTLRTI